MATVLVADDDVDIRDLVTFKLTQAGHEVIAVEDGPSALAAARENHVDIALLDIRMPGMSGLDVCRELRASPATELLPVILLTARSQEGDVETGFAAGADDYIIKPFSPRELTSRLQAILVRAKR
ncbi:response regulator [Streptomyces lunaelactis]|uniref:Response regulator n=1 Tax=Streptomyces lunaelactis TaxID=1535768 RepID=A0A2R4T345_9ACTN|nr:response regulator [Streptomyces lunaelactis]AVZ73542.1 response regulator [Streptomyces lunaelactis]NUK02135.1 response regulator [Streptomyces lunaelactis]NUK07431.1 response regulator [Streptomyces lunaelactis]NUK16984.1 response regulator [Streptomyces lunaelactis]NUK24341.1 response regulator [Streptomyces lunaelactis]